MTPLTARIQAYKDEGEQLDWILSRYFDTLIKYNPPRGLTCLLWYLDDFSVKNETIYLIGRQDRYDGDYETCVYTVPEDVILDGDVEAYAKGLEEQAQEDARAAVVEARRKELERLEARSRILRGELSDQGGD